MKKRNYVGLFVLVLSCATAGAEVILAGFDGPGDGASQTNPDGTPDVSATGWGASITSGKGMGTSKGSDDLSFGSLESPAAGYNNGLVKIADSSKAANRKIIFTLSNGTGGAVDLEGATFRFDWAVADYSSKPTASDSFSVSVLGGGALGNAESVELGSVDVSGYAAGYTDFDFAFADADFANYIMSEGDIEISIVADTLAKVDGNHVTGDVVNVDNLAVTVIPEPAAMGLLAVFGGGLLYIRRIFQV